MFSFRAPLLHKADSMRGFIELHCHLLPGVDDGVRTMDEAIRLLEIYDSAGIDTIILTPHIHPKYPYNNHATLIDAFNQFSKVVKDKFPHISIYLAAEYLIDDRFESILDNEPTLTLGVNNHILVEFSFMDRYLGWQTAINSVHKKHLIPVLAHPERYAYLADKDYEDLLDRGIQFQLNLYSLVGMYDRKGINISNRAKKLLQSGLYTFVGTDTHRPEVLEGFIKSSRLSTKFLSKIEQLVFNNSTLLSPNI